MTIITLRSCFLLLALATSRVEVLAFVPTRGVGRLNLAQGVVKVDSYDESRKKKVSTKTDAETAFDMETLKPTTEGTTNVNRRDALTAGGASLLLVPLLKEILPEMEMVTRGTSVSSLGATLSPDVLKGDSIVRNLWLGRIAYPVLVVSLEMGLFEALKGGPLSKDMLGARLTPKLKGEGRVLEALVAVLSALDLLDVREQSGAQQVRLTQAARHTLLQDSPFYWGSQLLAADGLTGNLRQAVRRDQYNQVKANKDFGQYSTEAVDSFIDSMEAHGSVTAAATAQAVAPVLKDRSTRHILDMAGGSGCFAKALSSELGSRVHVTLADIPPVVKRFQDHEQHGSYRSSIRAVAADLFEPSTWPTGPDCHFMANVLHDWSTPQVLQILMASQSALQQSSTGHGRLVIVEQLLADDQSGPLPAALASVSMLLGDWRTGKQYSFAELKNLLERAGFNRVELGPRCGEFHHAVFAEV